MTPSKQITIYLALTLLTSCASTDYGPAGTSAEIPHGGYLDTRTNINTATVSFNGNQNTPIQTVESYLMYRSAQLTLKYGYDYFVITSSSLSGTNVDVITRPDYHNQLTSPPTLHRTYYMTEDYKSYRIVPTGMTGYYNQPTRCNGKDLHKATFVIKMFNGSVPPGLPNAFEAQDVIGHIEPMTLN